ncbi:hypothetical protein H8356DRAFT_1656587 [Neocallimastix lanati (nom. inval.)]|jgi:chromosome segregation ATPase|nr:hypothetical protein H8356DRAFT_1656587 [Neocallimastix sp. JGI-2020a]
MDSKVAMSILAATVTTIAAAVCTRKLIVDKKQSNSPEKRLLKKKQRSMVKSLSAIETDSKKLLEDIKKVQGIILEFMKNNNSSKKQQNNIETENYEKTVIENDIDSNASIDSTDSVEKTIIDNEGKEEEEEEEEEKVENSTIISTSLHEKEEEEADKNKNKNKKLASLQSIRVDGYLIEMKIKGLDEYLLRLLERLDSLRPKALMEEVREIYSDKEGLEDVIPYIEHKVEKIKKRKKALVLKIQSYLENVDKLAGTVSGKNGDIEVVESVAKLWEVKDGKKKHLNFKFKL